MTPAQLARAVRGLSPPLARALLAVLADWQRTASRVSLARLEGAVAAGDVRLVVRLVLGDAVADAVTILPTPLPDAAVAFTPAPTPAAIAAASRAEAALLARAEATVRLAYRLGEGVLPPRPPAAPVVGLPEPIPPRPVIVFRAGLPDAAVAARGYADGALGYLRAEAAAGVRVAVEEGLRAGVNPRDVARGLRDVVGLGESQARWVANLREELEAGRYSRALERQLVNGPIRQTLAAAVRTGRPLTAAQVDRIVAGYGEKWRAWHAETVARTMALDLARHGQDAAMRAAIARGDYAGLVVFKTWVTTLDGRERDAHRALNGRRIRFEETWNDDGVARRVPGGWNCRCSVRMQAVPEGTAATVSGADLPGGATSGARMTARGQQGTGGADSPGMTRTTSGAGGAGGGGRGRGRGLPPRDFGDESRLPVVRITGEEFGPASVSTEELRRLAKAERARFVGPATTSDGQPVLVGRIGWEKIFHDSAARLQVQSAAALPEALRTALRVAEEDPRAYRAGTDIQRTLIYAARLQVGDDPRLHVLQVTLHDRRQQQLQFWDLRVHQR